MKQNHPQAHSCDHIDFLTLACSDARQGFSYQGTIKNLDFIGTKTQEIARGSLNGELIGSRQAALISLSMWIRIWILQRGLSGLNRKGNKALVLI